MKVNGRNPLSRFQVEIIAEKRIDIEVPAYDVVGLFEAINDNINCDLTAIDKITIRRKERLEK